MILGSDFAALKPAEALSPTLRSDSSNCFTFSLPSCRAVLSSGVGASSGKSGSAADVGIARTGLMVRAGLFCARFCCFCWQAGRLRRQAAPKRCPKVRAMSGPPVTFSFFLVWILLLCLRCFLVLAPFLPSNARARFLSRGCACAVAWGAVPAVPAQATGRSIPSIAAKPKGSLRSVVRGTFNPRSKQSWGWLRCAWLT